MNIQELQLGNFVWEDYGGVHTVTGINSETNQVFIRSFRANGEKTISAFFDAARIMPIKLDKYWFELFGFTPRKEPYGYEKIIYPVIGLDAPMVTLVIANNPAQTFIHIYSINSSDINPVQHIEYVHQLQNFIHAYTGKDALYATNISSATE